MKGQRPDGDTADGSLLWNAAACLFAAWLCVMAGCAMLAACAATVWIIRVAAGG